LEKFGTLLILLNHVERSQRSAFEEVFAILSTGSCPIHLFSNLGLGLLTAEEYVFLGYLSSARSLELDLVSLLVESYLISGECNFLYLAQCFECVGKHDAGFVMNGKVLGNLFGSRLSLFAPHPNCC